MRKPLRYFALLLPTFLSCLFSLFSLPLHSAIFYVTSTGAGAMNGTSWNDSYPSADLQTAIDLALPGDQVWVSCGTYYPTTGTDRNISFNMRQGVEIYGSFQGNETSLNQRVLPCGPCSVLSGEIGNNTTFDNSYTVVWNENLDSTAVLDGFEITRGNDDRPPSSSGDGLGGGIYNHGFNPGGFCSPTIRNCIFFDNNASYGGGAFNNGYNQGESNPTYINCVFDGNVAEIDGAGMDSYGVGGTASPTLHNCIFRANVAVNNAGAMYAWGGAILSPNLLPGNSNPRLYNCLIYDNAALNGSGGGIVSDNQDENASSSSGNAMVLLKNSIVWANQVLTTSQGPQFHIRGTGSEVVATFSDIDTVGQLSPNVLSPASLSNIFVDPLLRDINNVTGPDFCWMTYDDGLSISFTSPCIGAGDGTDAYPTDITGRLRFLLPAVDIGPYEVSPTPGFPEPDRSEVLIFPNPATDHISLQGEGRELGEIALFNALGQLIRYEEHPDLIGEVRINLDLADLTPGIYLVRTRSGAIPFKKE